MRLIHAFRLILVLAVALASVHTAIGRAEARGAQQVVVCAGGGTATVSLDAHGQPVRHLHICPDCVLGGLALTAALPPQLTAPRLSAARLAGPGRSQLRGMRRMMRVRSRGPPARG